MLIKNSKYMAFNPQNRFKFHNSITNSLEINLIHVILKHYVISRDDTTLVWPNFEARLETEKRFTNNLRYLIVSTLS